MNATSHRFQREPSCKTLQELKRYLQSSGATANPILQTILYDDSYMAAIEVKHRDGTTSLASHGWGQWVVVIMPLDSHIDEARLKAVVPELRRSDSELTLPAFATGGGTTSVQSITRTIRRSMDSEWASDNNICLEFLGPQILSSNFNGAVIAVDSSVLAREQWVVGGCEPGTYQPDFNYERDLLGRLERARNQHVVTADFIERMP